MKKIFALTLAIAWGISLNAQNIDDPVLIEIGQEKIYKSEFMSDFLRSAGKEVNTTPGVCTFEKRKALNDYLDLFVKYRTKLRDAYEQGFDTARSTRYELNMYRSDVAAPFLIDSATLLDIYREAYERNHFLLHASHLLVNVPHTASPSDTLRAFQKAMSYYHRAVSGEDFNAVADDAQQYYYKELEIAKEEQRIGGHDLGFFTVFDMVYPFENAAYNLQPGEISKPVRSNFGYHVIKLHDKIPYFDRVTFQHIWISAESKGAESKINNAYSLIKDSNTFSTVCRDFSDDRTTSMNGGLIPNATVRQIPAEYTKMLATLKPGEFTKPFSTQYGWHILLLKSRTDLPPMDDMLPIYKQRLSRDVRNMNPQSKFVEQSKVKYHFVDHTKVGKLVKKGKKKEMVYEASLDESVRLMNDSVFWKAWHFDSTKVTDLRPLITIEDKNYTTIDFLKYVANNMHPEQEYDLSLYAQNKYDQFANAVVFKYADQMLERDNKEFRDLMTEYRNGIMLFAYNEKYVWSKAINDSLGLNQFYAANVEKHLYDDDDAQNYWWNDRAQLTVVSFPNPDQGEYIAALLQKAQSKGWTDEKLMSQIQKKLKSKKILTEGIEITHPLVEKDHQQMLLNNQWRKGIYLNGTPSSNQAIAVENLFEPTRKNLREARGFYISDYQNNIDEQLIEQLNRKYNVKVHQEVVDEITY